MIDAVAATHLHCGAMCRAAVAAYVEDCQETFSIADERGGGVEISLGENSCPAVLLYHPTGYSAMVRIHLSVNLHGL